MTPPTDWSGSFTSNTYSLLFFSLVKGRINVKLGEPDTEYTSNCTVNYTGYYRSGESLDGTLEAKGDSLRCNIEGMIITFKINSRTDKYISGTYSINSPYDYGTFSLNRS